jgi:hypothetical protein
VLSQNCMALRPSMYVIAGRVGSQAKSMYRTAKPPLPVSVCSVMRCMTTYENMVLQAASSGSGTGDDWPKPERKAVLSALGSLDAIRGKKKKSSKLESPLS